MLNINRIENKETEFGYLTEVYFTASSTVNEDFWTLRPKDIDCDSNRQKKFYIQYLHDTPLNHQLSDEINKLFVHVYFPQRHLPEESDEKWQGIEDLVEFKYKPFRSFQCYAVSKTIVEYAIEAFPELNLKLLGNAYKIGRGTCYPEAIQSVVEKDEVKSKYIRFVGGIPHVLAKGSYGGNSFAFDSMGMDFLCDESKHTPLTQVFVASDDKTLNKILNHRYYTDETWYQFTPQEGFRGAFSNKKFPLS